MRYLSKADMVTAQLRELIIGGELRPGSPLRQRDLAAMFEVSQTPVREALRRLESEGLARNDPHKGSVVAEARAGLWNENYAIRAALESLAGELACEGVAEAELDELSALNARMRSFEEVDDDYRELNKRFHLVLCESARSPMLLSFIRLLWRALGDGPHVLRSAAESTAQHEEMIDALRAHNAATMAAVIRRHILGAVIAQDDAADGDGSKAAEAGAQRGIRNQVLRTLP